MIDKAHKIFRRRAELLLKAGIKPVCLSIDDLGHIEEFVYESPGQVISNWPVFTDVEHHKVNLILTNMTSIEFGLPMSKLLPILKYPVRVNNIPNMRGELLNWSLQFDQRDLQNAIKHLMNIGRECVMCISYAPNQKEHQ